MHNARTGGNCAGRAPLSRWVQFAAVFLPEVHELTKDNGISCRQTLTVEALGWTEFSLCCVTLAATLLWMRTGLGKRRSVRDSRTFV